MIVALFPHESGLVHATGKLREAGIGALETYTPAPLQGETEISSIPVIILIAGLVGGLASLGLQTYSYTIAYPFDIGGRPQFAWPSFTPTVFENAVLLAIVVGFIAFMIINRFPKLYDPIDEAAAMREVSRDGWVLAIRGADAEARRRASTMLLDLGALSVEEVAG